MRAVLYAVRQLSGWEARLSVDWDTDWRYWSAPDFRRNAELGWHCGGEAGNGISDAGGKGDKGRLARLSFDAAYQREMIWLKQSIPLGLAETICARLAAARLNPSKREWQAALIAAAGAALAEAGEYTAKDGPIEAVNWQPGMFVSSDGQAAFSAASFDNERCSEEARIQGLRARIAAERLRGRSLLLAEAAAALNEEVSACLPQLQLATLMGGLRIATAVKAETRQSVMGWRSPSASILRCRRCGSDESRLRRTACAACGRQRCAYCEACLSMGRARECGLMAIGLPVRGVLTLGANDSGLIQISAKWRLSDAQREAALAALRFLHRRPETRAVASRWRSIWPFRLGHEPGESREFLLWAVTGAGKTEMIFPLLASVLAAGGRAAVVTPRKDVVLELAPRLAAAFPDVRRAVLYGGSEDRFESGALTLATTHQMIRFREAFDLIVIDEVDAYPYHNDPMLRHAAQQARAQSGFTVLLSATPPPDLQRRVRWGLLPHARVAVRYHRRPLPVPRRLALPPMRRWIAGQPSALPQKLLNTVRHSVQRGAQTFMFVPYIRQVEPLVRQLRQHAATLGLVPAAIDGTSSQDPDRIGKVAGFRARNIRLLVTTTILERGVTIAQSDIFVMEADNPLFDAASLVQMAGRAGRSAADPAGSVYFAAASWTLSQRDACRQIRGMNAYARKRGELITMEEASE